MVLEIDIENFIVERLGGGKRNSSLLKEIQLVNSTSDAVNLYDLIGDLEYSVFQENTDWNTNPKLMVDIIGGMVPDIVIRSEKSSQNRIIIEVKSNESIRHYQGMEDSQIVRYFLNLLTTTDQRPSGNEDIKRAIILAAPKEWFEGEKEWRYFVDTYQKLAESFGITFGEIHWNR